jgi:hypothetical protein
LSEEIAKPLERYRPSFYRQIAKVKKFPSLPQNEPARGQKMENTLRDKCLIKFPVKTAAKLRNCGFCVQPHIPVDPVGPLSMKEIRSPNVLSKF